MKKLNSRIFWAIYFLIGICAAQSLAEEHRLVFQNKPKHYRTALMSVTFDEDLNQEIQIKSVTADNLSVGVFNAKGSKLIYRSCLAVPEGMKPYQVKRTSSICLGDRTDPSTNTVIPELDAMRDERGDPSIDSFRISNDLGKIVFERAKNIPYLTSVEGIRSTAIYVYDFETQEVKEIVPFGYICEKPIFSPDADDPYEAARMIGQYVVNVHAQNVELTDDGKTSSCGIAHGIVDYGKVLEILKSKGFDGCLEVEFVYGKDKVAALKRDRDFLARLAGKN